MTAFNDSVNAFVDSVNNYGTQKPSKNWLSKLGFGAKNPLHQYVQKLQADSQNISKQLRTATPNEIADGLRILSELIPNCPLAATGIVAISCGSMVENGGDPTIAGEALLKRLPELLEKSAEFHRLCLRKAEADPKLAAELGEEAGINDLSGEELGARYAMAVLEENPDAVMAANSEQFFALAVIAHLSRSKQLRAAARTTPQLVAAAEAVDEVANRRSFLRLMLRVLDDEQLLVLHPEKKKGYQVRISGIADNYQLQTLMLDALIGDPADGWLEGKRPDPLVVALARDTCAVGNATAEAVFMLWNYTALQPDGTFPDAMDTTNRRIWGEGNPGDIIRFDGTRTVLLGSLPWHSTWSPNRVFSGMTAELVCERKLSADEVSTVLKQIMESNSKKESG